MLAILAGCGGGGESDDDAAATTTTAAVEEPATTETTDPTTDDPAEGDVDEPRDAETGDPSPPPDPEDDPDDAAASAALTPPAPGRYQYELRREGGSPSSTSLVVETIAEGPGVVQQFQRFEFEVQRRLWIWNDASAVIDRTETSSDARYGGAAYSCVWAEPPVMLAAPLDVRQRWTTSTSCTFEVEGREIRHDASEEREVVDRRTTTVGGRDVEVVVMERTTVLRSSGAQPFTQTVTSVDEFAPSVGLLVRSETTAVLEDASGSRRGARAELALQSLSPQG